MRVGIIGAGSSGIVAAKILAERGIAFDCFEKGSGIGGNWRYRNDNGMSAAYRSLHINTSREKMAYSDFPMPEHYPDFPHHSQILDYFESYVDHFGFRQHIQFRTDVESVHPDGSGRFRIRWTQDGRQADDVYDAVLVANGHHWSPDRADIPGGFGGKILHSHDYTVPEPFAGKRVVVVGVGNSGVDIACELARVSRHVVLSSRRGAHIVPKYILGRPLDAWNTPLASRAPIALQRLFMRGLLYLARGPQSGYGFPTPDTRFLQEHPTVSSELLNLVGHGEVEPRPAPSRFEGNRVVYTDGSSSEADAVILATGYRVSFPFLDDSLVPVRENRVDLYQHVVSPDVPNLYFIGLVQPLGAIMPLAEMQSEWVADLLDGRCVLPRPAAMRRSIERDRSAMKQRYIASPRHTLQVDFYPYARRLRRARRRSQP